MLSSLPYYSQAEQEILELARKVEMIEPVFLALIYLSHPKAK